MTGMKKFLLPLLLIGGLAISGCSTSIAGVAGKAVGVIAKPVFSLAIPDASTTLLWVEAEVAAGRLSEADAVLARLCPDAVLALDALRTELEVAEAEVEGRKGLIFYATEKKFGRSIQLNLTTHITTLAVSCIQLIPQGRLLSIF